MKPLVFWTNVSLIDYYEIHKESEEADIYQETVLAIVHGAEENAEFYILDLKTGKAETFMENPPTDSDPVEKLTTLWGELKQTE